MKNITYISILVVVILIFSCKEAEKGTAITNLTSNYIEITADQFEKNNYALRGFNEGDFPKVVNATGLIDVPPENKARVSAIMGGYIKSTPLLIGDSVKKGQVLVTLENPAFVTLQQEYMELNEQLVYLKSEYDRQQTMMEEKITSQKSFLKAESDYKTSLARQHGVKKQLEMLHISSSKAAKGIFTSVVSIHAPTTGTISKTFVSMGTYVSPASPILEIINNDHIHLELSVFEKDILTIKKGQEIAFKIPEASDQVYSGEVYLMGNTIDENRTIKIHGHIENETEYNFIAGMFVDAKISTSSEKQQALPSEAIVSADDLKYVLVLDKKENGVYYFLKKEVKTKDSYRENTSIINSKQFANDAQFLVKGAFSLIGG